MFWIKENTLVDAQKGPPSEAAAVKPRVVPSGYIEDLNYARTKLVDFFSILLGSAPIFDTNKASAGGSVYNEERGGGAS